jgi:DNA polymerase epsilon subunit 1
MEIEKLKWEFPNKVGAVKNFSDSILEYINFLSHALSIDENIKNEVIIMKRNCLKLLKISDFSEQATYCDPSLSLVI